MNASHEWLSALLPGADLTAEQMRDIITARCCTVDEVAPLREDLAEVVIGRVVEAAPHPNSDHLWVTRVDAGLPNGELLDVVCGAPNVRAGASYPFAPAGSTLPGGLKLEKRKIRGAVSNGMLCSARELGLGQDHEGILELDTSAPPGTPFLSAVAAGDVRLVIDVTPNRPDLLSHLGLARELGAATDVEPRLPAIPASSHGEQPASDEAHVVKRAIEERESARTGGVKVHVQDASYCPRYMGAVVRGVKVAESPEWLANRLVAIGSRPINNVVDITNYVLHELGQPMHAFDAAKLAGPAIVVRRARDGERLLTLDGVERTLDETMTVIADAERAQAIAGVIGGGDSEVTDATTDVFLEVAYFDPAGVRRARRKLGVSTDASYRFERGVDRELQPLALARAIEMLVAIAGGRVDDAPVDIHPAPVERCRITLRPARVSRLLGVALRPAQIERLLESVGYSIEDRSDDHLTVVVPSWRPDVTAEVDLLEEVARLRGYDTFPSELLAFRPGTVPDSPVEVLTRRLRDRLVATGLLEARPMPFVRGAAEGFARVANPLAENEAYLRRDLLDTLSRRAEFNFTQMQRDIRLFEIGSAFFPTGRALPAEELRVAALVTGSRRPAHWTEVRPPDYDEWDAKGLALEIATVAFPGSAVELRGATGAELEGGLLWRVVVDATERGAVRRLALDAPVWAAGVFGVELSLLDIESRPVAGRGERLRAEQRSRGSALPSPSAAAGFNYRTLPSTPASDFDIALLVPDDLPAARVEEVIRRASGELLERLILFDEYRGEGVPAGERSLAWRLTFRHPERTLRDKEIAGRRQKLLRTLEGELGVRQRTT
ncbi:MAG TPA: phenylalanine--tRNA ligase subunit beta [Gemmatimonadaceae bacterium]|nr:phenylalanine--tRNA ligase subunit beta [Gemmatimonadaceae bacterium]